MSCATSACFGSPRGLLSCCKTYERHLDTVEVIENAGLAGLYYTTRDWAEQLE
jgi:hypothetical protein